ELDHAVDAGGALTRLCPLRDLDLLLIAFDERHLVVDVRCGVFRILDDLAGVVVLPPSFIPTQPLLRRVVIPQAPPVASDQSASVVLPPDGCSEALRLSGPRLDFSRASSFSASQSGIGGSSAT